jgi:hypothetical protein
MSKPQSSKRERRTQKRTSIAPKYGYCSACGLPIHNRGAHAEACIGRWRRCQALVPGYGHGIRHQCNLTAGHEGPHDAQR